MSGPAGLNGRRSMISIRPTQALAAAGAWLAGEAGRNVKGLGGEAVKGTAPATRDRWLLSTKIPSPPGDDLVVVRDCATVESTPANRTSSRGECRGWRLGPRQSV